MLSSLPSETPFCQIAFNPALYQEFPLIALFSFAEPLLSMGGLAARAYLQSQLGLSRNDVDALITVGTPHQGSWETQHCIAHPKLCAMGGLIADSVAMKALKPGSKALDDLNTTINLPPGVSRYVSIVARWAKGNTLTRINPEEWGEPGDGMVTASSQDFLKVTSFAALVKPHTVVTVEFDVNPFCGTQHNFTIPVVNTPVYVNEVHTCETHDPYVQHVIVQS